MESARKYLEEISKYPLLSAEREKELAIIMRNGGEEARRAKEKLICSNLRLVVMVAMKYLSRGLALTDLIQEGNLGLMEAVKRFDGRKRNRFATYAFWWIRVAIQKALMRSGTAKIPFYFNAVIHKITKAEKHLRAKDGFASISEIAIISGLSEEEVIKAQRARKVKKSISLNQPKIEGEEEEELIDFLVDEENGLDDSDIIRKIDLREKLNWALGQLPERTEEIICLKKGYDPNNKDGCRPETYRQIGGKFNLTGSRIKQIYNGALKEMRKLKKFEVLKEIYLER